MSMLALKDVFDGIQSIKPGAKTSTATGIAVDMANCNANFIAIVPGTITDGTHTPKLQECATSGGTFTDVAAGDQVGTFAAIATDTVQMVSYIGNLRYIKVISTVSGATTGGVYGATVYQKLRKQP